MRALLNLIRSARSRYAEAAWHVHAAPAWGRFQPHADAVQRIAADAASSASVPPPMAVRAWHGVDGGRWPR